MSEEEQTKWRAFFHEPDEAELHGTVLDDAPQGYASWSAWAASRWPSLPDEYAEHLECSDESLSRMYRSPHTFLVIALNHRTKILG